MSAEPLAFASRWAPAIKRSSASASRKTSTPTSSVFYVGDRMGNLHGGI